MLATVQAVSW